MAWSAVRIVQSQALVKSPPITRGFLGEHDLFVIMGL